MEIIVNGQTRTLEAGQTLSALLLALGLDADRVAVERNLAIVAKGDFDTTILTEDDTLEIVQFVGGG